jgi:hypothetical protein
MGIITGHASSSARPAKALFILEAIDPAAARTKAALLENIKGLLNPFTKKALFKQLKI